MSFRKFAFNENQKVRKTLFSKGGSIEGDLDFNGNWNINGALNYDITDLTLNGDLNMDKNSIINNTNIEFNKNLGVSERETIQFFANNETTPRALIWYQNADLSNGIPDLLRLGSGSNKTSWSIALRDPQKIIVPSTSDVNQLSYGYDGYEPTSIFAINYTDNDEYGSPDIQNLLRIQANGTTSSSLLYTKDGKLSVGNSYTDVSNNGGYRLDINGDAYIRGDTLKIGTERAIPNATDDGEVGEICWGLDGGNNYIYVCVSTNTWKRVQLSSWP